MKINNIEDIIRRYSFDLSLDEDEIIRIKNLVADNLDSDSDYETIVDVLEDYNDGTPAFDDLCTDICLELNGDN